MLRRGRVSERLDEEAAKYTSSLDFDNEILEAVAYVNAAHIKTLARIGVIGEEEARRACRRLGEFVKNPPKLDKYEYEDIHMVVEEFLAESNPGVASMLSFGKSRNDAVVTAIKLRLRQRLLELYSKMIDFSNTLLLRARREASTIFPVYTHLQRAAPATFGFILHAYAIRVMKLMPRIRHILWLCEESPLGSAAVSGTSIGIDRDYEAKLLGFSRVSENALEATASRDFLIDAISLCVGIATVLGDLAEELVIYSSEEFRLVELPDELSATSSIMPQKKNPIVMEIARTKVGETLGLYVSVVTILSRQPSGYNLDLQQVTPKLWRALDEVSATLGIMSKTVSKLVINVERARKACGPPTGIVELANHLTTRYGVPFRKAHGVAGRISRLIAEEKLDRDSLKEILDEVGLGDKVSLEEVMDLMRPERILETYSTIGSANPKYVEESIGKLMQELETEKRWVEEENRRFERVLKELLS